MIFKPLFKKAISRNLFARTSKTNFVSFDLGLFPFYIGGPVPLYCEERVERRIRHSFDYAFREEEL